MATNNAANSPNLTQYAVVCGGTSSSFLQTVASLGTSGQVLTSNGAGALPSFQTVVGGGLTLISSQSASSSATIDFTSISLGTYRTYELIYRAIVPATDGALLTMQISTDGGSTWKSSNYTSGINTAPYNSTTLTNVNSTSAFELTLGLDNGVSTSFGNGQVTIFTTASAATYIGGIISCFGNTAGTQVMGVMTGRTTDTGANAFRMIMSSGNITSGQFYLYGYQES